MWFGQKEPIKVQNFRTLTDHVKFYQIYTLVGYFSGKYIKFQVKRYRGVMPHDTEEWCKICIKTNLFFQKWQDFGKFWSEHSKVSNICTLTGPFCAKYITFDLKMYRGITFPDTKKSCKIWKKTDLRFWKMTWRIWKIFTWTPGSVKIETFMGSFCQN